MNEKKIVLVADDSSTARFYLCSILEKAGYKTEEAENGNVALKKIVELKPFCMILDLLMPELDGFDVLRNLKELKSGVPVIVLSADIQDEVKSECIELGAKGFISKPFKEQELLEALQRINNN